MPPGPPPSRDTMIPAVIPRPVLLALYGLFALHGLSLWVLPSEALIQVAGHRVPDVLGTILAAAGITAAVGATSTRPPFRWAELGGAILCTGTLAGYAIAPLELLTGGDTGVLRVSILATGFALIAAGRVWMLIRNLRSP